MKKRSANQIYPIQQTQDTNRQFNLSSPSNQDENPKNNIDFLVNFENQQNSHKSKNKFSHSQQQSDQDVNEIIQIQDIEHILNDHQDQNSKGNHTNNPLSNELTLLEDSRKQISLDDNPNETHENPDQNSQNQNQNQNNPISSYQKLQNSPKFAQKKSLSQFMKKKSSINMQRLETFNLNNAKKNKIWEFLKVFGFVFLLLQFNIFVYFYGAINYHQKLKISNKYRKTAFLILMFFVSSIWQVSMTQLVLFFFWDMSTKEREQYEAEMFIALISMVLIWILYTVYGKNGLQNNGIYWYFIKQDENELQDKLILTLNKLLVSDNLFVFKFLQYEDPEKQQQTLSAEEQKNKEKEGKILQKRLKLIEQPGQQVPDNQHDTLYSGKEFTKKLYEYLQKKAVQDKVQNSLVVFVSIVTVLKALIPAITRYVFDDEPFFGINIRWSISYIQITGLVYGMFIRAIFATYDLKIIHGFTKVSSQLINIDCYTKCNKERNFNYPPIDILDINSIITWNNIKKLGLQVKKKETVPLDAVSAILGVYWIIMVTLWFAYTFGDIHVFSLLFKQEWAHKYAVIDLLTIMIFFLFRVVFQMWINQEFENQLKQLQKLKNIVSQLQYQSELLVEDETNFALQTDTIYNFQQFNYQRLLKKFNSDEKQIQQYLKRLMKVIEYVRQDIKDTNKRKPFKFLGLIPASQNILISLVTSMGSMLGSLIYYMQNKGVLESFKS